MFEFTECDYKAFQVVLKQTQDELFKTTCLVLEKYYPIDKIETCEGNIIAHGDIPVALVAHMDTVFTAPPTEIFYDREKQVIWSPYGLGADDRAGVYGIYTLLQHGLHPTVIFMRDEEECCAGAYALVKVMQKIDNVHYMIELDRAHDNDCVFYDVANPQFQSYVESFGFKTTLGSFSDIRVLSHYWEVCSVNLSIGYEFEHTAYEYFKVNSFLKTLQAVEAMLLEPIVPKFDYIEQHHSYYIGKDFCHFCGNELPLRALDKIVTETGTWNICDKCLETYEMNLGLCEHCFNYFIASGDEDLCPECKQKGLESRIYGKFEERCGNDCYKF